MSDDTDMIEMQFYAPSNEDAYLEVNYTVNGRQYLMGGHVEKLLYMDQGYQIILGGKTMTIGSQMYKCQRKEGRRMWNNLRKYGFVQIQ